MTTADSPSDDQGSDEFTRSRVEQVRLVVAVLRYRPRLLAAIVVLSVVAAALEGVGVGFLLPLVEQASASPSADGGPLGGFAAAYAALGVPFTLETVVLGVMAVTAVRYTASVAVTWFRARLGASYDRDLKCETFDHLLDANAGYVDRRGSDELLNAVVTQTSYPARVAVATTKVVEQGLVALAYLVVALVLAPVLAVAALTALGVLTVLLRYVLEPAYATGDQVATANERIQQTAQAGIQGHRDVKLFGRRDRTFSSFRDAVDDYADATVRLRRTEATLKGCYRLGAATVVFGLVYLALTAPSLSLGSAAVFLFAMFRLAPRFSTLNSLAYGISGDLPHLARARETLDELADASRPSGDVTPAPPVAELSVDGVGFAYEDDPVLDGVTIHLSRGDTVALVGPSGGGKSTIVALLARLQDPDSGVVRADGTPLPQFDLAAWRQQVAVVRQDPYLFDETLRANVAVGDPTATDAAVRRACRRACVDEFVDDLPAGLDTPLGEDGVSLSGGQRQRVAIARALLEDASVLVLDEATSDLDPTIEAAVHEGLAEGDDDRITVLVSHRLASVADVDRIYTVADGAIAEVGDHDSLLDDDGTYAAMVAAGSRDDRRT